MPSTEERIKEAARKVFIRKGLAGARMQEIADEARINKAMLHYYYRSKKHLFRNILDEVMTEFAPRIIGILGQDLPLKEKIDSFVSHYLGMLSANPFIPLFVFTELRDQPQEIIEKLGIKRSGVLKRLEKQLNREAAAGRIKPITSLHFLTNLISLSIFPFLAQPLLQGIFAMDQQQFEDFIEERKSTIGEFFMAAITPT